MVYDGGPRRLNTLNRVVGDRMMNWVEFQKWCAALCAWREARGDGNDGIRGVLHVIANRSVARNRSWAEIVYQPLQFSSMTYPHDPQLTVIPIRPDPQFDYCYEMADLIFGGGDFDLTNGAQFYFADSIPMPDWAKEMTATAKIGRHNFYKGAL